MFKKCGEWWHRPYCKSHKDAVIDNSYYYMEFPWVTTTCEINKAEAYAAGEAVDEGKVLLNQFNEILSSEIDLRMVFD